jgi:hypothetical protein
VAGEGTGRVVVLTGDEPVLLFDGDHRVPVHTDLASVGEMRAGYRWRSRPDQVGEPSAGANDHASGDRSAGRANLVKDLNAEASVSADPAGRHFALAYQGKVELVDSAGNTRKTFEGIESAIVHRFGRARHRRPRRIWAGTPRAENDRRGSRLFCSTGAVGVRMFAGQTARRYRILGPVTATPERHSLELGAQKQRAVLAALLVNANRSVPEENLFSLV